jgi:hypothetical protein
MDAGEHGDLGACTAAHLFGIVWNTLADVIGTPATATLVRRSARRARLDGVSITRDGFNYAYRLPAAWHDDEAEPLTALRALARELAPLLVELTGPVLMRRLAAAPDLERCRVIFQEGGR